MRNDDLFTSEIPSRRTQELLGLVGAPISCLRRYSWWPPYEAASTCAIEDSLVFSLTAGPLLLFSGNELIVGASSDPSLVSVILWIEQDQNGKKRIENSILEDRELYPIDACDPIYSTKQICDFIGCHILSIRILMREPENIKWNNLPRQAGIILACDNNRDLILSHGLHDDSDDFSVITNEQLDSRLKKSLIEVPLSELEHLQGLTKPSKIKPPAHAANENR